MQKASRPVVILSLLLASLGAAPARAETPGIVLVGRAAAERHGGAAPTSPARGAADPSSNLTGPAARDIDGDVRIAPADIGADEIP